MPINIGNPSFNIPTYPDDLVDNLSNSMDAVMEFVSNGLQNAKTVALVGLGLAAMAGPYGVVAAYVAWAVDSSKGLI